MKHSPRPRPLAATATCAVAALTVLGVVQAPAIATAGNTPATTAARAADAPSRYPVKGIDTSHHNHDATGKAIAWTRVARSNAFAFLKATQGTRSHDGWFARDYRAVSATTLMRAPYHFFAPRNTRDGVAQADHFVRTVRAAGYTGTKAGDLPPVLDLESVPVNGKDVCPKALRADQLRTFLQRVKAAFRVTPIVYTRASFVNDCMNGKGDVFRGYPLWLARYSSTAKEPQNVPGAGAWTFWQYTEAEKVPGVPGQKNTVGIADRNVYRGSLSQLRAMAHLGADPRPRPDATWPTLRQGSRGTDVTTAQLLLTSRGYSTRADGSFGARTRQKISAFQRDRSLTPDGVIGATTWNRLVVTLKAGMKGRAVTALQHQLRDNGYQVSADGVFGRTTETRLKAFQQARDLGADGVAGARTWTALVAGGSGH
ncbi:GH25 family lysozyme [Streptomyces sp. LN549]|uniref:GH25 family lysozyme n=1 Tax=Streptomyces sp. LN549 TaxID=3112979 RepID=UPI0037153144